MFNLKIVGGQPKLAEPAKKPVPEGAALALADKRKNNADIKGPPCDIEKSLSMREAAGAVNAIVKEAKPEDEQVFTLKQTGPIILAKNNPA